MASIYDFSINELDGSEINFSDFKDKVLLLVNTASKCGFAPQLKTLERFHEQYGDKGLIIIGFPSNQFNQELDDEDAINEYCQRHFGVTFPMTKPISVNGKNTDPIFQYIKKESGDGPIKWNFTKFLIGRDGKLIKRYAPITAPEKFEDKIVSALA
ncbi:glutathione peroxidase [Oenococcus alcoholitolerans]|uniref:Glutathione peroxidase n=1 Tax=Oenococcus alcoholitolerans TaxID=931074 RepID=A0ABR4XRX4_9LACO|nr:glutathione peroxidase [Oenococcus alcoholitolerans]